MIAPFTAGPLPRIVFGDGVRERLPEIASRYGRRVLLVTGARSLRESGRAQALERGFAERGLAVRSLAVRGEPTPERVDDAVREHRGSIDVVVGVGGGSALDAAKAIAGLLPSGRSVMDFLEGVGAGATYEGPAAPVVAAPTTAGTGSEATRNAVLSRVGPGGFKKSFRHDALVPLWAVVDPELLEGCPRELIAADGMDALTQLLESYVSTRSSPFTDALAESGLAAVRDGLLPWYEAQGGPRAARGRMAWAALLSGVTLAHAGLGAVHGLAAALGARFPLPHGYLCGTLVAAATRTNVAALRARDPEGPALAKFARASAILAGNDGAPSADAPERLARRLEEWTARLHLDRLGPRGVARADVPDLVQASRAGSMQTNPVTLTDEEIAAIVEARL